VITTGEEEYFCGIGDKLTNYESILGKLLIEASCLTAIDVEIETVGWERKA
jgi:hypothetical protein